VDVSHRSAGGKPAAPEDAPFVTIGHIMKQLASAFATPFESDGGGADESALSETKQRWDRN
jgi:hypothetical protein